MPDVYATIAEADDELQERIAATLELRAADPAQRAHLRLRRAARSTSSRWSTAARTRSRPTAPSGPSSRRR